jgi:hypothetical protein
VFLPGGVPPPCKDIAVVLGKKMAKVFRLTPKKIKIKGSIASQVKDY